MKTGAGKSSGRIWPTCVILYTVSLLFVSCTSPQPQRILYSLRGTTMGTIYSVKVAAPAGRTIAPDTLQSQIDTLLAEINQVMSTYITGSELSRLNGAAPCVWHPVSRELMLVLAAAQEMSEKSGGAFDVTVGPLVNLWGFGPEKRPDALPDSQAILARKSLVGYSNLLLKPDSLQVMKLTEGMYCDLSAIAKGYGVDCVAERLEARGIYDYMVEIGGEVRVRGLNTATIPWRIGISSPRADQVVQKVISPGTAGVATSGDYRNYYEKEGVRYSHTIDPHTGRPITHKLASVSVVHASCMMADAYATAIDVLGPERGLELAEQESLAVFMLVKSDSGFSEISTAAFDAYVQQ